MHVCIFPGVKGLHNSIVLVVSILIAIMKDKVALLEEQMVDISLFAWYGCHGATLPLLIIHGHTVRMRTPNIAPLIMFKWDSSCILTRPFPFRA